MGTKVASYSRSSFKEEPAPRDQKCACGCGEDIKRKSMCFVRPYVERGRVTGHTRIVNMEHYDDWFENVASAYSKKIIERRPEAKEYFNE